MVQHLKDNGTLSKARKVYIDVSIFQKMLLSLSIYNKRENLGIWVGPPHPDYFEHSYQQRVKYETSSKSLTLTLKVIT